MDFSTPCYARPDAACRWLAGLFLGLWLATSIAAPAADKSAVRQASIGMTQQGYALDADVNIALNRTLENALSRGINLYFLLELELTRPRNWWFDENIVESTRKMRLYYHLLLRRYVVETGYTTQTVSSLPEALEVLGRVEDWQVLERGALKPGQRYEARLRLRLDAAQLPKPLSLGAVAGDKWELATPWHEWSFEAPSAPAASVSQPLP